MHRKGDSIFKPTLDKYQKIGRLRCAKTEKGKSQGFVFMSSWRNRLFGARIWNPHRLRFIDKKGLSMCEDNARANTRKW